jgi:hypothetical protein
MSARSKSNSKRRIQNTPPNPALVERLVYTGNPLHKRNPGDFKLDPPGAARPGKTLCDGSSIFSRSEALKLLKQGFAKGLVSVQTRDGWPQNIWAVSANQVALEAQHEGNGCYHGYPLQGDDPLREEVLARWSRP